MYLTTTEAARELGISQRRVIDYIHDTRLPAEQVSGRWLIKLSDLQLPAVRHRSPGRPPGRKSPHVPFAYQPTPHYMREYILQRDGLVCQLCLRDDQDTYDVAHIIGRGPSRPANLFIACRSCNVRQGQQVWVPHHFESITLHLPHWRAWVLSLASLPPEQQQIRIARDLHIYACGL